MLVLLVSLATIPQAQALRFLIIYCDLTSLGGFVEIAIRLDFFGWPSYIDHYMFRKFHCFYVSLYIVYS